VPARGPARGLGNTNPNPPVGCVIVDTAGAAVGAGYHRKGVPHAERLALDQAGDRATGGTAVVTLEPCNHVGRTPACHQGLLDAGIRRVVVSLIDPTSRREGGVALLRDASLDVEVGFLADEARLVIGPWLNALGEGRPMLTAICAGDDTRTHARAERAAYDAIVLESGTVEEGIAAGHGQGVLYLPTIDIDAEPVAALDAMYAGGVRILLVEATARRMATLQHAGVPRRGGARPCSRPADRPAGRIEDHSGGPSRRCDQARIETTLDSRIRAGVHRFVSHLRALTRAPKATRSAR
jgi:diaminohydroxyphosphoribosylaminopyrimidine deaminase/5-amino-6-(5-phosphoribosylamino)uracil reductase